jgi:spore germination cell wall hydrolase CwlJ-like protein
MVRARACLILPAAVIVGAVGVAKAADIPTDMRIEWGSIVVSKDELVCLALNDYWEARSEVIAGRLAVGRVVLNRAMDPRFPSNLCDVIKQSKIVATNGKAVCQFSWVCEGKTDVPDSKEWRDSVKIAVALTQKDAAIPDPTGGALWYHADFTRPVWASGFESTTIIGTHVFYREPDSPRSIAAAAPRKPFIYRLNAFAEFAMKRNARTQVAALQDGSSAVAMKNSAMAAQPIAR